MSRNLPPGMRLGFDLVQVSRIAESIEHFGAAFEQRLFTREELAYAHGGTGVAAERLAARFAAKEAVIKALQLSEAGMGWHDIEVRKRDDGDCEAADCTDASRRSLPAGGRPHPAVPESRRRLRRRDGGRAAGIGIQQPFERDL